MNVGSVLCNQLSWSSSSYKRRISIIPLSNVRINHVKVLISPKLMRHAKNTCIFRVLISWCETAVPLFCDWLMLEKNICYVINAKMFIIFICCNLFWRVFPNILFNIQYFGVFLISFFYQTSLLPNLPFRPQFIIKWYTCIFHNISLWILF